MTPHKSGVMTASKDKSYRNLALNRKALRDYVVQERHEAGIELRGTEVKSVREGHINLSGAYANVEGGQVKLYNVNIPAYEYGNRFNHEPDRPRRLLLHRKEINRLQVQTEQKGYALIPIRVYSMRGLIKVELGLCKGKRRGDKREVLKRRTADREADRAIKNRERT